MSCEASSSLAACCSKTPRRSSAVPKIWMAVAFPTKSPSLLKRTRAWSAASLAASTLPSSSWSSATSWSISASRRREREARAAAKACSASASASFFCHSARKALTTELLARGMARLAPEARCCAKPRWARRSASLFSPRASRAWTKTSKAAAAQLWFPCSSKLCIASSADFRAFSAWLCARWASAILSKVFDFPNSSPQSRYSTSAASAAPNASS
mmetsp:Transcript_34361/g.61807  ORF Transcript_34361/g.61807 Transcript_34361/m.61807 type:complete len:215 (-) Transcript_34361:100-744(-)